MSYLILLKNYYACTNPLFFMISLGRELVMHTSYYREFNDLQKLLQAVYYRLVKGLYFDFNDEKWVRF